jgi:hypothetical protein
VGIAGEDDLDAPDLIGPPQPNSGRERGSNRGNGRLDSLAARTPVIRPEKPMVANSTAGKAKVLAAVPLGIALSASLRDVMIAELNEIGSEDAATKWAHQRLKEKNKLNAADAKHIEEAFRAKLLSFAIHHSEGIPESKTAETKAKVRISSVGRQILIDASRAAPHSRSRPRAVCRPANLPGRRTSAQRCSSSTICQLRHSLARSATSSQSRCAGDTIARFIGTAMKPGGGRSSGSIRPAPHVHCGSKAIHKGSASIAAEAEGS